MAVHALGMIKLQPDIVQGVWRAVGVVDDCVGRDALVVLVEADVNFVVGTLLPAIGTWGG
jgi:hypothetical protein